METEVRRYRVIEAVGRGGFGTVYRAELVGPSGFRKEVALKVLNPDAPEAAGVAERLRDEARVLGMLRHRAIVQVDGLHLLGGRWTVVMEFVEGVDLKQLLAARGKVPAGVALEIVQEVANALHYAYELSMDRSTSGVSPGSLRLLHRDIKPGNIQLTAAGEVKVLDFGVARADFADREAHTQSVYFGSLNYMSPERLDGIDDHKGDIYALGAMLYELVMGEALGRTSASRERHDARLREALGKLWDQLPSEDLYRLIAECLLYDPDARPTARELERACRTLRPGFGAPWLSEWAEQHVPGLLQAREPIEDDLSGATLVEQGGVSGGVTDSVAEDVPVARPQGRRKARGGGRVVAAAAGTALLVVVGGGLILGKTLWSAPGTDTTGAAAAAGEAAAGEAPAGGEAQADALDELGEAFDDDEIEASAPVDPAAAPPIDPWFMEGIEEDEADGAAGASTDEGADASTAGASTAVTATNTTATNTTGAAVERTSTGRSSGAGSASRDGARSTSTGAGGGAAATAGTSGRSSTTTTSTGSSTNGASSAGSTTTGSTSAASSSTGSTSTGSTNSPAATPSASTATGSGNVRLLRAAAGLKVVLVDGSGSHPLGRVPAGHYTVRASFPDGTVNDSLGVDVSAGGTVTLTCNVGLKSCVKL